MTKPAPVARCRAHNADQYAYGSRCHHDAAPKLDGYCRKHHPPAVLARLKSSLETRKRRVVEAEQKLAEFERGMGK